MSPRSADARTPSPPEIPWPDPPVVAPPAVAGSRRSWGEMSYEQRFRMQHESLMRITLKLAEEKGYDGTQIAQIVALAGVSRRTFYEHFGSKDGCFAELIVRACAAAMKVEIEAAEPQIPNGPYATFLAMVEAWSDMMRDSVAYPLSGELSATLWAEAQKPDSPLAEAMGQMLLQAAGLFFVAARRLGSPLDDELLMLATRQQVIAMVQAVKPRKGKHHTKEHQLLAQVMCVAFGFPPATVQATRSQGK